MTKRIKIDGSRGEGGGQVLRTSLALSLVTGHAYENVTEVVTGFGERGLADPLMVPFALAGGGRYRTVPLTRHAMTNVDVIQAFLDLEIHVIDLDKKTVEIVFGET